jgi:hypothetical protein
MNEMLVPWMYEVKTVSGEQYLDYFNCIEAIKLEFSFQIF